VYVVSAGALVTFGRAANGMLAELPGRRFCIAAWHRARCRFSKRIPTIYSVTVSVDGRMLYLTGEESAITLLRRNRRTGAFAPVRGGRRCLAYDPRETVRPFCRRSNLVYAEAVVVSPDGHNVYAYDSDGGRLGAERVLRDGSLRDLPGRYGCLADRSKYCGRSVGIIDESLPATAISPDGQNLYYADEYGLLLFARRTR
jgi:DNA-binding beta-propeller fold protein YncE